MVQETRHTQDLAMDLLDKQQVSIHKYTDDYKNTLFWIWYKAGKPNGATLRGLIEPTAEGILPSDGVLKGWIYSDFVPRAEAVDEQVNKQIAEVAVKEKVEMLERHTDLGKFMQDTAKDYLIAHKEELKPHTALKMLVDGIEIERKSRGLPGLITAAVDATDEALRKQVEELLNIMDVDDLNVLDDGAEDGVSDL